MLRKKDKDIQMDEAIEFFKKYKSYFNNLGVNEDNIQNVLLKFHQYYDPTKDVKVSTFCKMLVNQEMSRQQLNGKLLKNAGVTFSIDKTFNDDGDDDGYAAFLNSLGAVEMDLDMDKELYDEEQLKLIKEMLSVLTKTQREVIEAHYIEGISLTDIALERGVTKQSVSQAHRISLNKMREFKNKNK